jgi:hypothetical protein
LFVKELDEAYSCKHFGEWENPKIKNCGVIQKMDNVLSESLLFFSIMAAATIENVATKRPNPIRCKGEMPDSWHVIFLAKGTKKVS